MAIRIAIIENDEQLASIPIDTDNIPILRQKSLVFNERLASPRPSISVNHSLGVDQTSVEYVLNNLAEGAVEGDGLIHGVVHLSGVCNALCHFKCEPGGFSGLYDQLHHPWKVQQVQEESVAPAQVLLPAHPDGALPTLPTPIENWQWRRPRHSSSELWPYYANAAWVLEKSKEQGFAEALNSIVFDSIPDEFPTAVAELRNLKYHRERLMKSVFDNMLDYLASVTSREESRGIGHDILRKIKSSKILAIETSSTVSSETKMLVPAWQQSKTSLSSLTIYEFVLQLDLLLLKGTSLDYEDRKPLPPRQAGGGSQVETASVSDDGPGLKYQGPKAPPMILMSRMGRMFKGFSHSSRKGQYEAKVKEMFDTINAHIVSDQKELVDGFLAERDSQLRKLREDLVRGPQNVVAQPRQNGHAGQHHLAAQVGVI